MKPFLKTALFGASLLLSSTSLTWALDKDAFVASVTQMAKDIDITDVKPEKVEISGDMITLYNVTARYEGSGQLLSLSNIVFNNIREETDGSYTAGSLKIDKIQYGENSQSLVAEGILREGVYIPAAGKKMDYFAHLPYSRQNIRTVTVTDHGKPVLVIKDITDAADDYKPGAPFRTKAEIGSFDFNIQNLPSQSQKEFAALGYTKTITGQSDMLFIWNPQTGEGEVSHFNISAKDVGTLRLSLKVQGVTQDFSKKLVKITEKDAGLSDQEASDIMQQVELKDFTVHFEDASITNRALDRLAEKQKTTRKNLITQTQLILPIITSQSLGGSKIGKKLVPELSSFLKNPKSLKISFSPAQAMSFLEIFGGIQLSPADTLDQLDADIVANK